MTARRRAAGTAFAGALCLAALAACAGTTRSHLAAAAPASAAAAPVRPLPEEFVQDGAPQAAPPAPGQAPAPAAVDDLPIAYVSGEAIGVKSFLTRIWMRSSDASRDILDRLVVESLSVLEAERQEITVSPTRVDERCEAAWKALCESIERKGRGISVAEYLDRELGVDSEYYRRQLRREAILQMLAERVVRSWAFGRERCVVRMVELADQEALDAFSAGLAAGREFDALAGELHRHKDKEPGGARITLIKNENAELSRVAFRTPEGGVAGPLKAEAGRHLMMRVEKFLQPLSGPWKEVGPAIEKSLIDEPVDDLEYVQWRAEMVKSYSVDLEPFFKLIGVTR